MRQRHVDDGGVEDDHELGREVDEEENGGVGKSMPGPFSSSFDRTAGQGRARR